ncbi:hypothetical protein E2562_031788 [Oryza meyeriana var. granulata]|uniref:Uncharacterized protein n=1 Tax=Oryza meyeriana var. granulata TaxID=110450 RepID=A0A6G1EEC1_9ORYZ|nr:hypothetical protein E2562_031788 [Oryza meyeriana var. granulata]
MTLISKAKLRLIIVLPWQFNAEDKAEQEIAHPLKREDMSNQSAYPNPAQGYYQGPPASAAAGQDNTVAGGSKPNCPSAPKKDTPGFMDNFLACLPCARPTQAKNDAS